GNVTSSTELLLSPCAPPTPTPNPCSPITCTPTRTATRTPTRTATPTITATPTCPPLRIVVGQSQPAKPALIHSSRQGSGKSARLLVYQDTDGDGNPSNATLLRQLTVTIGITETFENYPVSVTAPGPTGDLYIGFEDLWAEPGYTPRLFPAAQDTTASQVRS